MPLTRREFMTIFGTSLASLLLTRCGLLRRATPTPPIITCYEIAPLTPTPTPILTLLQPREQLRLCWLRFDELAEKTSSGQNQSQDSGENPLGQQMLADHRAALDELVALGVIEAPVADLIHEAYSAAVYHVWRSNAWITCYKPAMPNYAPISAGQLVQQAAILAELAEQGKLNPETVALARQTIEHDLAFEALTDEEVQQPCSRWMTRLQATEIRRTAWIAVHFEQGCEDNSGAGRR